MMRLVDLHTHNALCKHATGKPVDYARAAKAQGLAGIGFSDHNPSPNLKDSWRMEMHELDDYLQEAEAARDAYPDFQVAIGLEVDYFPSELDWIAELRQRYSWDYFIGSVHYVAPGWDVDNPRWIGRLEETGVDAVWQLYWTGFQACARSGLFDLLAHVDLVKKFGHRPEGDLRRFYEPAVEAMLAGGSAMEVSTAGLRKPIGEIYPARQLLEMVREAGIEVAISSDAHAPEDVGADFAATADLLRELGFRETVTFERGQRRHLPLE